MTAISGKPLQVGNCSCIHCLKDFYSSRPYSFDVFVRCRSPQYIRVTLFSFQCEHCQNGWFQLVLISVLMFIVWMMFMPFQKDLFVYSLTIFHVALSTALYFWKVIPFWIVIAPLLVLLLKFANKRQQQDQTLIGIFVFYVQFMESLIYVMFHRTIETYIPSSTRIQEFVNIVGNIFNLKGFEPHCWFSGSFSEPITNLIFLAMLPVFVLFFAWFNFSLWYMSNWKGDNERFQLIKHRCAAFWLSFLNFAYFPILNHANSFILNPCQEVTPDISIMKRYQWIICGSEEQLFLRKIAFIIVVFYFAMPLVLFLPLCYIHRSEIGNEREDQNARFWFSSLYIPYKSKCRIYMHTIVLINKVVLAAMVSAKLSPSILAHGLTTSMVIFAKLLPYKKGEENSFSLFKYRYCCISQRIKTVGTVNFFQVSFLFLLAYSVMFTPSMYYSLHPAYGTDDTTLICSIIALALVAVVNLTIVLLFLTYLFSNLFGLLCFCRRKSNRARPLLSHDAFVLRDTYASLSNSYILVDATCKQ